MSFDFSHKSSADEIRRRFDDDVERFSNLNSGQVSTVDALLAMDLVASAAAALCPSAKTVLDIGCGAGNYSLKLLEKIPGLDVTLLDLSRPMLERALSRVQPATSRQVRLLQGDVRQLDLGEERYDLILAAAVLHHLREEEEWRTVFAQCHTALRPGGGIFIFDLVAHSHPAVQQLMWTRYGAYLTALKGEDYREHVFAYIEKEDTPRSLVFQLEMLKRVGFSGMDVLHKNSCFAAFYAFR